MSKSIFLILIFSSIAAMSGCANITKDNKCDLLDIAFNETNELAPDWYRETLNSLKSCGMDYKQDALNGRGLK